jgi:ferrochelatase
MEIDKKTKTAVLLVNLGSPRSPEVVDVKSFLKVFLDDACVLTMPAFVRSLLVHQIIAPIRAPRSAKLYRQLWDERGSPLIYHSMDLHDHLREKSLPGKDVFMAMRYEDHGMKEALERIHSGGYQELLILPLFPHYTSSTAGSILEEARRLLQGTELYERTRVLLNFHDHNEFIRLWIQKVRASLEEGADDLVFSYHGIPVSHAEGGHGGNSCDKYQCKDRYNEANQYCYHAACCETTRRISEALDFPGEKTHHAYQSRFGRRWLGPQTKDVLSGLAKNGSRRVVVACPSFVADCLETEVEIGHEYGELFLEQGGESLHLVPSLNSDAGWVEFLRNMLRDPAEDSILLSGIRCNGAGVILI